MLDHRTRAHVPALILRSTISAAVLDEGAVLLDLESKYFYALNASAWALTQLLEEGSSATDVAERARAWGAPDDVAVLEFIERLIAYGLLEPADASTSESDVTWSGPWTPPSIERQAEPLQNVMVSAFDPSIPLAE
jgi:hypothetical protein